MGRRVVWPRGGGVNQVHMKYLGVIWPGIGSVGGSKFLQQDNKWRQLSFWRVLHKLQRGDMFSLRTCILQ